MKEIEDLTDRQAVDALSIVAELWLENDGLKAYAVMQQVNQKSSKAKDLPGWATGAAEATPELAGSSRRALLALMTSSDANARKWAREAITRVNQLKAHAVDPLTLTIGGMLLIGLVLAVRVKKVKIDNNGNKEVELYEGLPKGLADLLKSAAKIFV